jgi:hypothetical protein
MENKIFKYCNRYGNIYTFTQINPNTILWEGDFRYSRGALDPESRKLTMVDPSGGPFLSDGDSLSFIHKELEGIIDHFERNENSYKIILK